MYKDYRRIEDRIASICLVLIAVILASCGAKEKIAVKISGDLNASVTFTGKEFAVTNKDNFDWIGVALVVNRDLQPETIASWGQRFPLLEEPRLGSDSKFEFGYAMLKIRSGETWSIKAAEFATADSGMRFDPLTTKLLTFHIGVIPTLVDQNLSFSCKTWDGLFPDELPKRR